MVYRVHVRNTSRPVNNSTEVALPPASPTSSGDYLYDFDPPPPPPPSVLIAPSFADPETLSRLDFMLLNDDDERRVIWQSGVNRCEGGQCGNFVQGRILDLIACSWAVLVLWAMPSPSHQINAHMLGPACNLRGPQDCPQGAMKGLLAASVTTCPMVADQCSQPIRQLYGELYYLLALVFLF